MEVQESVFCLESEGFPQRTPSGEHSLLYSASSGRAEGVEPGPRRVGAVRLRRTGVRGSLLRTCRHAPPAK
jgi:hypothetical protein